MFWKAIFVYLVLMALAAVANLVYYSGDLAAYLRGLPSWKMYVILGLQFVDILLFVVGMVGVFLFAFKRSVRRPRFWRGLFWLSVVWELGYRQIARFLSGSVQGPKVFVALALIVAFLIVYLPQYVAVYRLGSDRVDA